MRRICNAAMKYSTFPSLRVQFELREAAESVLRDGETLSSLIETSVREAIQRRRAQEEFIGRGLHARENDSVPVSTTPPTPFTSNCSVA